MDLLELKEKVDSAVNYADECYEPLEDIIVSVQITDKNGKSIWADKFVELHYDNNYNTSGCVITGHVDLTFL